MTETDGFRYCDRCGVLLTKDNNKCGYEICDKCNEWLVGRRYARYNLIDLKSRIKNHKDFEGDRWDKAIDMVVELIDERLGEI